MSLRVPGRYEAALLIERGWRVIAVLPREGECEWVLYRGQRASA